jgi:hypothetical protein
MQTLPFGEYGFTISVLLVGITLAIAGFALGIGYVVNDKRLKEFGKDEIIQSIINGALVGGLIALFVSGGPVDSVINSIVMGNGTSMSCSSFLSGNSAICFAYNYLVGSNTYAFLGISHVSILTSITSLIVMLLGTYAVLGLLKTFLSPLLSMIQSAVQALGAAAVSVTVQASVLAFIAVSALTVLLPAGLVLRSLYPTRKLGGFLIALAISLYVVLPLTYVMNATISSNYQSATNSTGLSSITLSSDSIKPDVLSAANQSSNSSSILSSVGWVQSWASTFLDGLFGAVASFIVWAFILPAFSLVLTGISLREMSRLLGSDTFFGKFNLL